MEKVCRLWFKQRFFDVKLDENKGFFLAYVSEHTDQDHVDEFIEFWKGEGVKVNFLKVIDQRPPKSN